MKVKRTRAVFGQFLEIKGTHQYLGVSAPTVSNWKRYLARGEQISLDKMEEMLLRFGAEVKQEKVWTVPSARRVKGCNWMAMVRRHTGLGLVAIAELL